jgi:hypothetical protein
VVPARPRAAPTLIADEVGYTNGGDEARPEPRPVSQID